MAEINPSNLEYDESQAWREAWERSKTKMLGKLAKKKHEWKERATSDEAEVRYALNVVEAVKERRRKKRLEEVSPEEWYNQTVSGTLEKTITEDEVRKWDQRSAPYREFVKQASEMLKSKGYKGKELLKLWAELVIPKLEQAKANPDLLPRLLAQLREEVNRLPPAREKTVKPEQITINLR